MHVGIGRPGRSCSGIVIKDGGGHHSNSIAFGDLRTKREASPDSLLPYPLLLALLGK